LIILIGSCRHHAAGEFVTVPRRAAGQGTGHAFHDRVLQITRSGGGTAAHARHERGEKLAGELRLMQQDKTLRRGLVRKQPRGVKRDFRFPIPAIIELALRGAEELRLLDIARAIDAEIRQRHRGGRIRQHKAGGLSRAGRRPGKRDFHGTNQARAR
jgi:hypothetical protein